MRTKGEGAEAAARAVSEYQNQSQLLQEEADATAEEIRTLRNEYKHTLEQFALEILPDADPHRVQQVAQMAQKIELMQQRDQWGRRLPEFQRRIDEIGRTTDYVNREYLLDPQSGELELGLTQARNRLSDARSRNNPYLEDDFQWVIQRENQKAEGTSMLQGFLRAITFAETREQRAKQKLVERFGVRDWSALFQAYQQSVNEVSVASGLVQQLESRREALENLIAEHDDLFQWIHHFEQRLTVEIQSILIDTLPRIDPTAFRAIAGPHAVTASKLHALQAKMKYLGQLEDYLATEARDRQDRAIKIERVRRLWERKPWDRLTGDKTKWLVTVPEMKKTSTEKRLRWSRKMRRGIADYDDYDRYDYYYAYYEEQDDSYLLPYDVFAYSYEERMPYEGFTGEVIDDIQDHREYHDLEKADYSDFKDLEKQYVNEEPVGDYENEEFGGADFVDESGDGVSAGEAAVAGAAAAGVAYVAMEEAAAAEEAAMEAAMAAEEAAAEEFADAS